MRDWKSFSPECISQVIHTVKEEMENLGERLGISITVKRHDFNRFKGEIALSLGILDPDGEGDFRLYSDIHGLKAKDLGRVFKVNKTHYKLLGYNPKRDRRFVVQNLRTGKRAALSETIVVKALARASSPETYQ